MAQSDVDEINKEMHVDGKFFRFRAFLARAERIYLEILRASALIFATLILAWILWLVLSSAYRISRDADAVEVAPVTLSAKEVADIEISENKKSSKENEKKEGEDSKFEQFEEEYFALYQSNFENFSQKGDKRLSKKEFSDRFLHGFDAEGGNLTETSDENYFDQGDFPDLLNTMRKAAVLEITTERLSKYRDTPKIKVEDRIKKTRQETYCEYYSSYFDECYYYATRSIPYTETISSMVAPDGVLTPQEIFGAYQDNYLNILHSRRAKNSSDAGAEIAHRLAENEKGWAGLSEALKFVLIFLGIMFFFLLIAMERHQRTIAKRSR